MEESYHSKDIPKEVFGCTKWKEKIRTMKRLFPKKGEEEITKIEGGIRMIDRNKHEIRPNHRMVRRQEKMQRRNPIWRAKEVGLHDSFRRIVRAIHRMGGWAVCQDEKCGHVSAGILTGVEERATGCMMQPDRYWDDSKTLMCSWRGQGKRWSDLVSSAVLLVLVEMKTWRRCQKSTSRCSKKQTSKNECYFMEEILQLLPVFSVPRHIKY